MKTSYKIFANEDGEVCVTIEPFQAGLQHILDVTINQANDENLSEDEKGLLQIQAFMIQGAVQAMHSLMQEYQDGIAKQRLEAEAEESTKH